jgi:hypothetical protein
VPPPLPLWPPLLPVAPPLLPPWGSGRIPPLLPPLPPGPPVGAALHPCDSQTSATAGIASIEIHLSVFIVLIPFFQGAGRRRDDWLPPVLLPQAAR